MFTSASGDALFTVSANRRNIHYRLTVRSIAAMTVAHIHLGRRGKTVRQPGRGNPRADQRQKRQIPPGSGKRTVKSMAARPQGAGRFFCRGCWQSRKWGI
ncbi:MAG: CHRD domain-containing protein [Firmicutes bacterium]|nr:CHRD domain-containing protein [Bacillota bacterium]